MYASNVCRNISRSFSGISCFNCHSSAIIPCFDRDAALESIDASLDNEVGFENRKPLMEEEISEELYESILEGFREEAEA